MKLGPVTKHDKRNTETSKKIDNDVLLANCVVIVTFLIYGQFGVIQKPDSGRMIYKTYIFMIVNFYFTKTKNRTKKSVINYSYYYFE